MNDEVPGRDPAPQPENRDDITRARTPKSPAAAGQPSGEAPNPAGLGPSGEAPVPAGFEVTGAPLGAGATAVVWPVRRVADGREFALKVWRRPFAGADERARFRREVRQHADLNRVSGHVVAYAWSEEDPARGTPWIGTEQHGTSLRDMLERGRPPLSEALVLGADLVQGLADMHEHATLHRDVKPANVLVRDGRAMLCDFGLVMDAAAYTNDNAAGTPLFVAPELLDGTSRPSTRTDVYSAARTLRAALGPNPPAPLEQLVTAAASVNPADRPADAGQLASAYRRVCGDLGYALPPPLPVQRSRPSTPAGASSAVSARTGPRRALLVGAGAALLTVVTAGVILVPDRDRAGDGSRLTDQSASTSTAGVPESPDDLPGAPDAGQAAPDITSDGEPIILAETRAGQCAVAVEGATLVDKHEYDVAGTVVAEVWTYFGEDERQGCAKLVKPDGSPYVGKRTHLAVTLCGDDNSCDHDWNAYSSDAGPVVVPSQDGCLSYRVSMLDDTGSDWLVRDDVGWVGCA